MKSNSVFLNGLFVILSVSMCVVYGSETISNETELGRIIATEAIKHQKLSASSIGRINAFLKAGSEMKSIFEKYETEINGIDDRCKTAMRSYRTAELETPLTTLQIISTSKDPKAAERAQKLYWEEWLFAHPEMYNPDFRSAFYKQQAGIMQKIGYEKAKINFISAFKELESEPVRIATIISNVQVKNFKKYGQLLAKL